MGGQELTDHGVHLGCEEGGGGRTLINTILYARCSTDRHTVHDIGEGRVAGPGQNKSDQTRPDQTDRLRSRSRVLCSWAERARDACSPPQASVLQSPRDLLRFVPLFSQDERKEEAVLGLSACPLGTDHEVRTAHRAALTPTRDDGYTYYARDMCCVSDLACVGKREAVGNVAVHPDALMSMQPSFHRCSRPRKKVCPPSRFSGCPRVWHVRAGTGAGDPQGCPVHPRFWFLFGNRVERQLDYPVHSSWGLAVVRNGRIFSFGFGHFQALPAAPFYYLDSLCCSLTRQATQRHRVDRVPMGTPKKRPTLDIKTPF